MLRNNATAAAVGSIVILVATACGTSTDRSSIDSTTTVAPSVTAPSTTQAPAESSSTVERSVESRALILALAGPQLGGGTFDPQSVAGREVLLWFWAPW